MRLPPRKLKVNTEYEGSTKSYKHYPLSRARLCLNVKSSNASTSTGKTWSGRLRTLWNRKLDHFYGTRNVSTEITPRRLRQVGFVDQSTSEQFHSLDKVATGKEEMDSDKLEFRDKKLDCVKWTDRSNGFHYLYSLHSFAKVLKPRRPQ
jgi:hypothetical protein